MKFPVAIRFAGKKFVISVDPFQSPEEAKKAITNALCTEVSYPTANKIAESRCGPTGWVEIRKSTMHAIFLNRQRKYGDRIREAADWLAGEFNKNRPEAVLSTHRWLIGPLRVFYSLPKEITGRKKVYEPLVFEKAWREAVRMAVAKTGIQVAFVPKEVRTRTLSSISGRKTIKKATLFSYNVIHAGEKITEVRALEKALHQYPQVNRIFRKKGGKDFLNRLIAAATGLTPKTVACHRMRRRIK